MKDSRDILLVDTPILPRMNGHPQPFESPISGPTSVRADLRHPFLEPRQVLGVVLRTGLANPPVRVGQILLCVKALSRPARGTAGSPSRDGVLCNCA